MRIPTHSAAIKIARGPEPDAGFESAAGSDTPGREANFLSSIAAARQEAQSLFELSQDLGASLSSGGNAFRLLGKTQADGSLRRHRHLHPARG